jgi:hypothetical protein
MNMIFIVGVHVTVNKCRLPEGKHPLTHFVVFSKRCRRSTSDSGFGITHIFLPSFRIIEAE